MSFDQSYYYTSEFVAEPDSLSDEEGSSMEASYILPSPDRLFPHSFTAPPAPHLLPAPAPFPSFPPQASYTAPPYANDGFQYSPYTPSPANQPQAWLVQTEAYGLGHGGGADRDRAGFGEVVHRDVPKAWGSISRKFAAVIKFEKPTHQKPTHQAVGAHHPPPPPPLVPAPNYQQQGWPFPPMTQATYPPPQPYGKPLPPLPAQHSYYGAPGQPYPYAPPGPSTTYGQPYRQY